MVFILASHLDPDYGSLVLPTGHLSSFHLFIENVLIRHSLDVRSWRGTREPEGTSDFRAFVFWTVPDSFL